MQCQSLPSTYCNLFDVQPRVLQARITPGIECTEKGSRFLNSTWNSHGISKPISIVSSYTKHVFRLFINLTTWLTLRGLVADRRQQPTSKTEWKFIPCLYRVSPWQVLLSHRSEQRCHRHSGSLFLNFTRSHLDRSWYHTAASSDVTDTVEAYSLSLHDLTLTGLVIRPERVAGVTVTMKSAKVVDTALLTPIRVLFTLVNVWKRPIRFQQLTTYHLIYHLLWDFDCLWLMEVHYSNKQRRTVSAVGLHFG